MTGHIAYHSPVLAPQDLRTVDPRRSSSWDDEKSKRVTAVRLEIRFGPDSDVARMLAVTGVAAPRVRRTKQEVRRGPVHTPDEMRALGAFRKPGSRKWAYRCAGCGSVRVVSTSWSGVAVCRDCKKAGVL